MNQRRKHAPHLEIHVALPQTGQIKEAQAVLQVPHCGGKLTVPHQGQVNLVNTCPTDNFLTIFYVLMKTRNKFFQYLLRSPELYAVTLIKICEMFNDGNFVEGKCEWLKLFPGRFNLPQSDQLDLWGNEEDLFVSRLYSALETSFTSTCPYPHCPSGVKQIKVHVNGLIFLLGYNYVCYYPSVGYTYIIAHTCSRLPFDVIRELKQRGRQRQRERHKTIGLMSLNNTLHVRFTFWYISLPSSAKQQREMTKF